MAALKFVDLLSELEWRSKVLKDLQYTAKLFVALAPLSAHAPSAPSIVRLAAMAKHLSLARRVFDIGSFLEDIPDIMDALADKGPRARWRLALGVANFVTDLLDDAVTLSKVKAVPPQWISARFERCADVLWALSTLLALGLAIAKALEIRRRLADDAAAGATTTTDGGAGGARLGGASAEAAAAAAGRTRRATSALHVTCVSIAKYVFDMVQCVPDAMDVDVPESLYALGGLLSGLASTYKIWVTYDK